MSKPLIFGHRGASSEEPENTMRAFNQAFFFGADGIEFDVHRCASNEIVIIHDDTIDRTADGTGVVRHLTLKELQRYNFGKSEKISTFEEVLKKFGNEKWLNIEIKEEGIEKSVIELLQEHLITEKVIISSFYESVIKGLKGHAEEYDIAFLYDFQLDDVTELTNELTLGSIHPGKQNVNEKLILKAHKQGLKVRSWTIDETKIACKFANWQIDGIITNDVLKIKEALQPKSS